MLPDEPMAGLISRAGTIMAPVQVMGERPAELLELLPIVVLRRVGGTAKGSQQDDLADQPLVAADSYALGLPAALALAQQARRALKALGGGVEVSGPIETEDTAEAAGVRRVTSVRRFTLR